MKNKKSILLAILLVFVTVGVFVMIDTPEQQTTPAIGNTIHPPASDESQDEPGKEDGQTTSEDKNDSSEDGKTDKKEDETNKEEEPVPESIIEEIHIVGLGDSLTKGSGDEAGEGYIHPVAEYIREESGEEVSLKNFGIHGLPSDKLVSKIDSDKVKKHVKAADYIFITIGGNDILDIVEYNFFSLNLDVFDAGLAQYRKNLFVIVQSLRSQNPDAKIYLIGMFNPFHNFFEDIDEVDRVIEEWNETIQLVADLNENTKYIPVSDLFVGEGSKDLFSSDKLHPNHEGYLKMAQRIENKITLPNE